MSVLQHSLRRAVAALHLLGRSGEWVDSKKCRSEQLQDAGTHGMRWLRESPRRSLDEAGDVQACAARPRTILRTRLTVAALPLAYSHLSNDVFLESKYRNLKQCWLEWVPATSFHELGQ